MKLNNPFWGSPTSIMGLGRNSIVKRGRHPKHHLFLPGPSHPDGLRDQVCGQTRFSKGVVRPLRRGADVEDLTEVV